MGHGSVSSRLLLVDKTSLRILGRNKDSGWYDCSAPPRLQAATIGVQSLPESTIFATTWAEVTNDGLE
ncbi:hypothetical protein DHEL01_v208772 [Diaporthe helianthi]|uniref:Uncharacterized protein n=1 Tax=Diaporthe helianthi TaxID=158607 RepID=A0A2P5HRG0_DIAHE|nr:hypothetical protein DHEL01_v208772 [Diaporthe helianthi]